MGRIYIYTDGTAKENLVLPLVSAAIYIPDSFNFIEPKDKNVYRLTKTTMGILKPQWESLPNKVSLSWNADVEKFGVYGSTNKKEKNVLLYLKAHLYLRNIEEYEIIKVEKLQAEAPEARLVYGLCRQIRLYWFEKYEKLFPDLLLNINYGNISQKHIQNLAEFYRLPKFYIWDRALRAVQNIHPQPEWALQELKQYYLALENKNGINERNVC